MDRCPSCAKDVQVTAYGRCPVCGVVVVPGGRPGWGCSPRGCLGPPVEREGCSPCSALVGVVALIICQSLVRVGQDTNWTSAGPGIFVMIGAAFSGLAAVVFLGGTLLAMLPGGRRVIDWLD